MSTGNIRFALPLEHLSLAEEGYFGFNLIAYGGWAWTVKMAVGPMDFSNAEAMEHWLANGRLLRAANACEARRLWISWARIKIVLAIVSMNPLTISLSQRTCGFLVEPYPSFSHDH